MPLFDGRKRFPKPGSEAWETPKREQREIERESAALLCLRALFAQAEVASR